MGIAPGTCAIGGERRVWWVGRTCCPSGPGEEIEKHATWSKSELIGCRPERARESSRRAGGVFVASSRKYVAFEAKAHREPEGRQKAAASRSRRATQRENNCPPKPPNRALPSRLAAGSPRPAHRRPPIQTVTGSTMCGSCAGQWWAALKSTKSSSQEAQGVQL